ncbi:MAG: hypothetical protein WCD18_05585 [Thermosynechococcaceae cyanobacterium]
MVQELAIKAIAFDRRQRFGMALGFGSSALFADALLFLEAAIAFLGVAFLTVVDDVLCLESVFGLTEVDKSGQDARGVHAKVEMVGGLAAFPGNIAANKAGVAQTCRSKLPRSGE